MECAGLWFVQLYGCGWSSTTDVQFHGSKFRRVTSSRKGLGISQTMAGRHLKHLRMTGAELLFEMLSQRYERGSTLITSNLPFQEWTEVLGSERLTGALLDRLTHHVHILEMNGDSYRLNRAVVNEPHLRIARLNSPLQTHLGVKGAASATLQRPFYPNNPTTPNKPSTGLCLLRRSGLVLLRP
jgi:hypothetical protein